MIRVVVVDDDSLVTESLKTILQASQEIEVVATGNSTAEAIDRFFEFKPDVLLMDIRMGESTGIEAATTILNQDSRALILLLTTFSDDSYIKEALAIGVKGYLIKQNFSTIVPAIKTVYNGQSVFGTEVVSKISTILGEPTVREPVSRWQLSEREEAILIQVAQGKNNKEIAAELFLSEGTVRNYLSQLLEKLALRDRTQLAVFYYQHYR